MYDFFSSILTLLFGLGSTSGTILVFFTTLAVGAIAYYTIRQVVSSVS
ncbi:MAG: hypothetical protein IAA85_05415 [Firmicutes bacterium]|nr:hypothetical protein [Candidatus Alectryobacillus merdavium]